MNLGVIVQARMGSQRLPGKMLYEIAGKPMLQYVIERVQQCDSLENLVVATSSECCDDDLEVFCKQFGVACFRGHLLNVACRFKDLLEAYSFDGFVRVSGDSPLIDQSLIQRGMKIFSGGDYELVTNVFPRSFPSGQSIEVLRADTFVKGYQHIQEDEDFEHVTSFFYKNYRNYRIHNFASQKNYGDINFSVDTENQMNTFSSIIALMESPHWQYTLQDVVELYKKVALD